ncbi:hypothetical protein BaRGS_00021906 [Batillaria attramentaria]|uniref:C2H2-type domain-containing protein n=1 Tax=Batillaria attramentaria TaxID=370345 RepID=A0ABD0KIS5_9CAEN|nr:hypothetical protein BaRGS_000723 [Batillaria attramentaria]
MDLTLRPPAPTHGLFASQGVTERVKDTPKSPPSSQHAPVTSPLLTQRTDLLVKPGELLSVDKGAVPLISPIRGPDLRTVALYHSLLRQHPLYHQFLENFLTPTLPPLLCHPAAALCDRPFALCATAVPGSGAEAHRGQQGTQPRPLHPTQAAPPPPTQPVTQAPPAPGGKPGVSLSPEDLVSSITPVPDPYQQYGYGRKLFPCPQCRYTTDRRNNLKRHMLTMHQVSAKMLECCGVLFRTKAALREHALIFHYHGYTCFYCGRRFCRKALLKRHLSVHNGQKEFICNVCDYATSHKSNLERHRRVHMRQDDDTSYTDEMPHDDIPRENSGHHSDDEISVCSHDDEEEEIIVHDDD